MPVLRTKQRCFIEEYLLDLNATQAAIRAGYSPKTAAATAYENLRKPHIQAAITAALQTRSQRTLITADRVLQELARVAFADLRVYFDLEGHLLPLQALSADAAAALASVESREASATEAEERAPVTQLSKLKLWDKVAALTLLGKHLRLFTDQVDISVTAKVVRLPSKAPSAEAWMHEHASSLLSQQAGNN